MAITHLGAQLFTAREEFAHDFAGTLQEIAALGYQAVELTGFEQVSAQAQREALDAAGLHAPSSHVGLWHMTHQTQHQIAEAQLVGANYIVIPWLDPEWRTAEQLVALGTVLNDLGRSCADVGITLGYHNHDFEFEVVAGKTMLDHLVELTDPALVTFELDVYWAAFAGHDPVALLRRLGSRIKLVHLKDMAADRSFTEVGDGTLAMTAIIATAQAVGTDWFFVEHDQPQGSALASLGRSYEYLTGGLA